MRKFLIGSVCVIVLYLVIDYLTYGMGLYIMFDAPPVTANVKSIGKKIYLKQNDEFLEFEIKGVNVGAGLPGSFATEFAIKKEDYLRWFKQIQDMGANTIRVYTLLSSEFYDAFYEYNIDNENPLYLLHGLWVNDYIQNSHRDAYSPDFVDTFVRDSIVLTDVIHGQRKIYLGSGMGSGSYNKDISRWVIGYILGVEWEDVTVVFTDHMQNQITGYTGKYMQTTDEATPFEAMLAYVGDKQISYETQRYGTQRLVAFSNWPTTDPFDYPSDITEFFFKAAKVDVEHIKLTDEFTSGTFASYHVYPYYPDYLSYFKNVSDFVDETGRINTYYAYIKQLAEHHTIPLVISEFGVPSSRGMAQRDKYTNRNQGRMSETDQARALVDCYKDIKSAGCAGSIVFTWQDEWFKRTWNTMYAIDLLKTAYWSDYQSNEQYFGLLSFDPGKEKSICYVDGDISEWEGVAPVINNENMSLAVMYDEKFIYMLAHKSDRKDSDKLFIPIDVTPKSGTKFCENYNMSFNRLVDFVISLDGKENSRIMVQERYEVLRARFSYELQKIDAYEHPPAVDGTLFKPINLILQTATKLPKDLADDRALAETFETGALTYGSANPNKENYNSLADYCFSGDYVEIKLPWQILNFSNPAEMQIHDDYYIHYGIEDIKINEIYLGIGDASETIKLGEFKLAGWGRYPTYHERLKPGYYAMQSIWRQK